MNQSTAYARPHPTGGYYGVYSTYLSSALAYVLDDRGNRRLFPDRWQAETMAWRAKEEAEDRIEAIRFDPDQIRETPKFHEARSRAGKRAFAERLLREAMRQGAAE